MSLPRRLIAASLSLALLSPFAAAGDTRAVDAGPGSGPTLNPISNNTNPTNGLGPINANTGLNTGTGVSGIDAGGAQAGAADAQLTGPNSGMVGPNGARLEGPGGARVDPMTGKAINPEGRVPTGKDASPINPSVEKLQPTNPSKTATQPLQKEVETITKNAASPQGDPAADLSHFFDAAHKYEGKVAGPAEAKGSGAGVAGRAQGVKDEVINSVRIANAPSTHPADVPGLFLAAAAVAQKAAAAGALSRDMAAQVVQKISAYAAEKAKTSLTELANGAYNAASSGVAGEREVERAVGPKNAGAWSLGLKRAKPAAFDQWEQLLGAPGKPLVTNLDRLKKDVWRAQEEASSKPAAASSRWAQKVSFRARGGSYEALLPDSSVARIPELTAQLALTSAAGGETVSELADYQREPTLANAFRLVRRRAGLAAAVTVWVKAAAMTLWQRILDGVASFFGRAPEQALVRLERPASAEEKAAASDAPVSFVNFSSLNAPYLAARRSLGRPGGLTVAQAREAVKQAAALADASAAITFNSAPAKAVAALGARLERATAGLQDGDALPRSASELLTDEGGLSAWLDKSRDAAFAKLDRAAFSRLARRNAETLVLADLSGAAPMTRVYSKGAASPAVYDSDSRVGAAAALENPSQSGGDAPAVDESAVSRVVSAYLQKSGKDRLEDFEAADPALSQFAPAEIVEKGSRGFWVERARRRFEGKVQDLYLLRDLRTRRPLYGAAVPAH